ncbi:SgcJ/EcaC family oxidoreductase [Streptomyces sp. NPDC050982]|uniref:SgcJ/EcaC family oxidoreductase n=1 Tax=Streptomyces sp. NPDC050982 TaxID=3154746 RepID=UPI0033C39920
MQRHIRTRAAIVTVALVAAGAVTVGVSQAAPEHKAKPAAGQAAVKPTKKQIAALFDGWNKALQTGDSKKVADRYAKDAVLLPTASPVIRTNHAEIVDYFDHFLLNKPKGEKIRSVINVLDSNSAIDAGLYVFQLTDPKTGEKKDVEARYTYEYEKRGGKWLIVNHHSSVLPAAS